MAQVAVRFDGVDDMLAAIQAKVTKTPEAARDVSRTLSLELIAAAKINATGPARTGSLRIRRNGERVAYRPGGPGVVTGRLRNSIQSRREGPYGGTGWQTTVAPATPYARRLELGFYGRDSLGRHYEQPAYPYMSPALRDVRARGTQIAAAIFAKHLT